MVDDKNSKAYDAFGNIFPCYEYPYTEIYQNDDCIEGNVLEDVTLEDKKWLKLEALKTIYTKGNIPIVLTVSFCQFVTEVVLKFGCKEVMLVQPSNTI